MYSIVIPLDISEITTTRDRKNSGGQKFLGAISFARMKCLSGADYCLIVHQKSLSLTEKRQRKADFKELGRRPTLASNLAKARMTTKGQLCDTGPSEMAAALKFACFIAPQSSSAKGTTKPRWPAP